MPVRKVNLDEKFGAFREHWSPKIAAEVNDSYVKLVKFQGEFVWHKHDDEDEMFLVVAGRITIRFRDGKKTSSLSFRRVWSTAPSRRRRPRSSSSSRRRR